MTAPLTTDLYCAPCDVEFSCTTTTRKETVS
jgi:hypothetical protein